MNTERERDAHYLIAGGVLLFLLGLLNGAAIPAFTNPRMGLSAHLAAVQSGMALALFGAIWGRVQLSVSASHRCARLHAFGAYAIWIGLLLAAALGTSRATPIAGDGFSGSAVQESLTQSVITLGALSALLATSAMLFGLLRRPN